MHYGAFGVKILAFGAFGENSQQTHRTHRNEKVHPNYAFFVDLFLQNCLFHFLLICFVFLIIRV